MSFLMVKLEEMEVRVDPDVKKVLAFIEANIPIRKCVAVANAVKDMSVLLWGHYVKPIDPYDRDNIFVPIYLETEKFLAKDDLPKQPTSIE